MIKLNFRIEFYKISVLLFFIALSSLYTCKENNEPKITEEIRKNHKILSKKEIFFDSINLLPSKISNLKNKPIFEFINKKGEGEILKKTFINVKSSPFDSITIFLHEIGGYAEIDSILVFYNKNHKQKIRPEFTLVSLYNNFLKEDFVFDHFNNDNIIDFRINTEGSGQGMSVYQYYLYNSLTDEYQHNLPLSRTSRLIYDKKRNLYKSSGNNGRSDYTATIFKLVNSEYEIIEQIEIFRLEDNTMVKYKKNGKTRIDTFPTNIFNNNLVPELEHFTNFPN